MELLRELHRGGATICMVTHDPRYAQHADRIVHLFDGLIVEEEAGSDRREIREAKREFRADRSEEHTSELQSLRHIVCRLLLEKKNKLDEARDSKTREEK